MTRYEELNNIIHNHKVKKIAEIGIDNGETARHILNTCHPELYIMVDIVANSQLVTDIRDNYPNAMYLIMPSVDAAKMVDDGSLDMVYIDADHKYESVKADILAWLPKVKEGGYIGGHDFGRNENDRGWGVRKAVEEIFGKNYIHYPENAIWEVKVNANCCTPAELHA